MSVRAPTILTIPHPNSNSNPNLTDQAQEIERQCAASMAAAAEERADDQGAGAPPEAFDDLAPCDIDGDPLPCAAQTL